MESQENPRYLSLSVLQKLCGEETINFLQKRGGEAWNCYEIFRRAIVEKNGEAWEVVVSQYQGQVRRWVELHGRFHTFAEEPEIFVNLVFEKFWKRNFSAAEFSGFPNVKSVMAYLKTCVGSVLTDFWRTQKRKEKVVYWEDLLTEGANSPAFSYQPRMEEYMMRDDFWEEIRQYVDDEDAFQVLYSSFVLGLKPIEIMLQSPTRFGEVRDVYKAKAKALAILAREFSKLEIVSNFSDYLE